MSTRIMAIHDTPALRTPGVRSYLMDITNDSKDYYHKAKRMFHEFLENNNYDVLTDIGPSKTISVFPIVPPGKTRPWIFRVIER